eukprot:TRINITY_DN653_c0_g1_i11.p1 TRINITY_DN653_c0_g1~~TRINITY_DN653_c0_g1_i11.p1  ORF type:complete len:391 (+),score=100.37 TRINITY_DN653_c0_g1_i11:1123-2295(+)
MAPWLVDSAIRKQLAVVFELKVEEESFLTMAVQLGVAIGCLVSGVFGMADRFSAKKLVFAASCVAGGLNALIMVWQERDGFGFAIVTRLGIGICMALIYPPLMKITSSLFKFNRGLAMGTIISSVVIATAVPFLIRALLDTASWQTVVTITSVIGPIGGLMVFQIQNGPFHVASRGAFDASMIPVIMSRKEVLLPILGYLTHMWELYALWGSISAFIERKAEMDGGNGGDVQMLAALVAFFVISAGGVGSVVGGRFSDRFGRTMTCIVSLSISGLMSGLIGFVSMGDDSLAGVIIVAMIWGFAIVPDSSQFSTMITELADHRFVGTALTLQVATGYTLTLGSIWLMPVVAQEFGFENQFFFLTPSPFLGVLIMLWLRQLPEAKKMCGGLM